MIKSVHTADFLTELALDKGLDNVHCKIYIGCQLLETLAQNKLTKPLRNASSAVWFYNDLTKYYPSCMYALTIGLTPF